MQKILRVPVAVSAVSLGILVLGFLPADSAQAYTSRSSGYGSVSRPSVQSSYNRPSSISVNRGSVNTRNDFFSSWNNRNDPCGPNSLLGKPCVQYDPKPIFSLPPPTPSCYPLCRTTTSSVRTKPSTTRSNSYTSPVRGWSK